MTPLLEIENLSVKFRLMSPLRAMLNGAGDGAVTVISGIELHIDRGETLALVGESGSGKSTLARAINGLVLMEPESVVTFDGERIDPSTKSSFRKVRRQMAMMFQDPIGSLNPRLTVRSLLVEPFKIHGMADRDLDKECFRLLDMVSLPHSFAGRYPHELSGGQARRVGVARALALDPRLIIADEPTAGLDVSIQGDVLNLLAELQERLDLTILIITHNLQVVRHVAHRTAIMYLGNIVEVGPTEEIFRAARHPYTRALLSCAPHPNAGADHQRIELSGEVPSLKNRPQGCVFHTRCPRVQEQCLQKAPPTSEAGTKHSFSCFNPH